MNFSTTIFTTYEFVVVGHSYDAVAAGYSNINRRTIGDECFGFVCEHPHVILRAQLHYHHHQLPAALQQPNILGEMWALFYLVLPQTQKETEVLSL